MKNKYLLKNKQGRDTVHYYILDGKGNKIKSFDRSEGIACFAELLGNEDIPEDGHLRVSLKKEYLRYGQDCVNKWIELMNSEGFPCEVVQDEIEINLSKYNNKLLLASALMIIRYLWMPAYGSIPGTVLEKMEGENAGFFMELQFAHNKGSAYYGNPNHALKAWGKCKEGISKEEFLKNAKRYGGGLNKYETVPISSNWQK